MTYKSIFKPLQYGGKENGISQKHEWAMSESALTRGSGDECLAAVTQGDFALHGDKSQVSGQCCTSVKPWHRACSG